MSAHCPPKCGGCSCHINPPCHHCTDHICTGCGTFTCSDDFCIGATKFQRFCIRIKRKYMYKVCARCGSDKDVHWEASRTQYHWDGKGEDPNRDIALCKYCAIEHHEHWDEMWKEYYSGCL